jgi:hypothetical protein
VNPLLRAALGYADNGWPVFPCHAIDARLRCGCGRSDCSSPGKHPTLQHGLFEASTDPLVMATWWKRWPRANVAIRTGAGSGLVVVDVDPPQGLDSLAELERLHTPLSRAAVVRTGRDGVHFYLGHPGSGARVANRASSVLGPGIDVRGDGGYVIAPPSRHASGRVYRWQTDGAPAPAPDWLVELLTAEASRPEPVDIRRVRDDPGVSVWAGTALAGEIDRVQRAPAGQRNQTLNRSAFVLGQIVAGGHLDHDEVVDLLGEAGCSTGLGEREVRLTVASGLNAGARRPRHPPERVLERRVDLRTVPLPPPADAPHERFIEREL